MTISKNYGMAVNTVVFDTQSACRKIGKRLVRDRKTNLLYCMGEWYQKNDLPYLLSPFSESGIEVCTELAACEGMADRDKLAEALLLKKWDAVFLYPQYVPFLKEMIQKMKIAPPELLPRLFLKNTEKVFEKFQFPFRKRAELAVKRMTELLNGDRKVKQIMIPMELVKHQK